MFLQLKIALITTYTLSDNKLIDSYQTKMTCVIRTNWRTIIGSAVKDFWKYAMIVWFKTFVNPLTSFARFSEEKTKGKKKRKRYEGITVTCKTLWYGHRLSWRNNV